MGIFPNDTIGRVGVERLLQARIVPGDVYPSRTVGS
jgi:hypothetical protein